MSDKKHKAKKIPSDAKILLDDWETLTRIIRQVATPSYKRQEQVNELLADEIINDATAGPYRPFLACKLKAYANLCAMRLLITSADNETLQEQKNDIAKSAAPLAKYVKKTTISDVDKRQRQLDELTNEHFSQWQAQTKQWIALLGSSFAKHGFPLSELETQELAGLPTVSELEKRFVDLALTLPDAHAMNFSHYFKLKAELIVRSSLARRQLPHTQKEIEAVIKQLKNVFNEIHKKETALIKDQEPSTMKIGDFSV